MPRKRILVNIFTTGIAFLSLALSFSRDDDLGRGVKGDASLYSFPVKLGYSMLRKRLHRSLTCPAGVLCAALYRCGTPHCLRLQHNAATASYQTIQPEATEDNLRLFQTVSWCAEAQAQNLPVLVGTLVLPAPSVVCG